MAAVTTEIVALVQALLKVIFDILTPAAAGPSPLQTIIYTGLTLGFLGGLVGFVKSLAKN